MRHLLGLLTLLALAPAGAAGAQGITLFGSARLGIGYNVQNNGDPALETRRTETVAIGGGAVAEVDTALGGTDDLRALSRIRFGVVMTGESDSGIGFGGEIRADNAEGGNGGAEGQTEGNVFVTGSWGTLTFGDTDGADYARVGDVVANGTLTGLGDYNQLPFLSNGGGSDNDELQFIADPDNLPTVRYDYDFAQFGLSLSTTRDLNAVGAGAGYTHSFGDASVSLGLGYYSFNEYIGEIPNYGEVLVPDGDEWTASLRGAFGGFEGGVGYASIDAGSLGTLDVLTLGASYGAGAWRAFGYYSTVTGGDRLFGEGLDGRDSYGASLRYDLGGGATVNGGVARTYGADAIGEPGDASFAPEIDSTTLADFGITLEF